MCFFKEEGNARYRSKDYPDALHFYRKVIIYGDYTFPEHEQDTHTMNSLLQTAHCNSALCLIKVNQWDNAKIELA